MQLLQYGLRPELLDPLWQGVSARIDGQGLAQFRGMKFLLTCRNLKSRTQGPSWAAAQARFFAIWSEAVDVDFLTTTFTTSGGRHQWLRRSAEANTGMGDLFPSSFLRFFRIYNPLCLFVWWFVCLFLFLFLYSPLSICRTLSRFYLRPLDHAGLWPSS